MLGDWIEELVTYGVRTGLTPECERIYTRNLLLDCFEEPDFATSEGEDAAKSERPLVDILNDLLEEAVRRGKIGDSVTERDLFDTKLMNCLMSRPAQVREEFAKHYAESPKEATDWFYAFSQNSNYIRRDRIAKDRKWKVDSSYGPIDITINLSKPEKDPRAIAAAGAAKSTSYPKCQLCMENEGYAGRLNHPARENHRIIPLTICGQPWGFQYSPYVYYPEHCIVFNGEHIPMKIERKTFEKLFDFVGQFPHYMLGSNADLPIVGGSILSHDHFQGGADCFAMGRAPMEQMVSIPGYEDVEAGIVHWPLSVLRIRHADPKRLIDLATHVLDCWRGYTDEAAMVYAETDGVPHNTITPIARKRGELFELDLTLRNNLTTPEHPMGLYHPHEKLHHIKKENIGLIEVMGMAILPARLQKEMDLLTEVLAAGKNPADYPELEKHADWVTEFLPKYDQVTKENLPQILEQEIGKVFLQVLEDAGVYKCTPEGRDAFGRFLATL